MATEVQAQVTWLKSQPIVHESIKKPIRKFQILLFADYPLDVQKWKISVKHRPSLLTSTSGI